MDENKRLADEFIENTLEEEAASDKPIYEKIEYNEDMTEFNLYVNGDNYRISTTMMEFVYFKMGMEYQITAGVSLEAIAADQKASEEAAQEAIDSEMEK